MKKNLATLLLAGAFTLPFTVQAQGFYLGANAGHADHKSTTWGYSGSQDESGYKLYGGYGFNDFVGIEAGYTHLGKLSGTEANSILTPDARYEAESFYVAATGTIPAGSAFSFFGKAGLVRHEATVSGVESGVAWTEKSNNTSLLAGLGAAYYLNRNASVVLEYEHYGKVVDEAEDLVTVKADMLSLGFRYRF